MWSPSCDWSKLKQLATNAVRVCGKDIDFAAHHHFIQTNLDPRGGEEYRAPGLHLCIAKVHRQDVYDAVLALAFARCWMMSCKLSSGIHLAIEHLLSNMSGVRLDNIGTPHFG